MRAVWLQQAGASPTCDTLPTNSPLFPSRLRSLFLPALAGRLCLWAVEMDFVKVLTLSPPPAPRKDSPGWPIHYQLDPFVH